MEKTTEQKYFGSFEKVFPIINPRKLIWHRVLRHKPRTEREKKLMDDIRKSIKMKLPAFRAAYMDPSEEDGKIVFKHGNKPTVGHSPIWWSEACKKFMPIKNSRCGTELHWAVFLGHLMKYLVEVEKYSVKDAWKIVCDDIYDVSPYKDNIHSKGIQKAGTIFKFANTRKIIENWESTDFWFAGGSYYNERDKKYPLANLYPVFYVSFDYDNCVGWLVMDV